MKTLALILALLTSPAWGQTIQIPSPTDYISSEILVGAAVPLTTSTATNLTSISLTPGDWDISCQAQFNPGATTNTTLYTAGISTTSNTLNTTNPANIYQFSFPSGFVSVNGLSAAVPRVRANITATTTYYCVAESVFSVSTMSVYGNLQARRVH